MDINILLMYLQTKTENVCPNTVLNTDTASNTASNTDTASNTVSNVDRELISSVSCNLMKQSSTTLQDIKTHVNKYGHITTLYSKSNVVDELLNLYCSGMGRKYKKEIGPYGKDGIETFEFNNDLSIIEYLICDYNANPNSVYCGATPITAAVHSWCYCHINDGKRYESTTQAIIDFLVLKGADINTPSNSYIYDPCLATVLKWGDKKNRLIKLNYMIGLGADPQCCKIDLEDILFDAVSLKWCVENSLCTHEQGVKVLQKICIWAASESYHYLINNVTFDSVIQSNNFNNSGHSLLHDICSASEFNDNRNGALSIPIIDDLIARGVSANILDQDGNSCLYYAVDNQNLRAVQHLITKYKLQVTENDLEVAASPRLTNSEHKAAIFNALKQNSNTKSASYETIKDFCSRGPSFIFGDWTTEYTTVLNNIKIVSNAVDNLPKDKYIKVYEMLLMNGLYKVAKKLGDVRFKKELLCMICSSPYLDTPIRVSSCLGDWTYPFTKTLELLMIRGADPLIELNGLQPLHTLCKNSHALTDQIQILIDYGADGNSKCMGSTAHDYAKKAHNYKDYNGRVRNQVVKLLQDNA